MSKGSWREFDDGLTQVRQNFSSNNLNKSDLEVRVQITRNGKAGKTVTLVTGLDNSFDNLKLLTRRLKALCGTGGTLKNNSIEIQGTHGEVVMKYLALQGYEVKKSGG